jgi:hypothetical protein
MQEDYGHWRVSHVGEFNPDDYLGFIYRVTFLLTGEEYIGKKQFHRMNKYGTKRYGPSNWKDYTTSSEHVNALLEEYPKECFSFDILLLATTKAIISYAESNILHKMDALITLDSCWGLPKYLNKRIDPVRWVTKDYPLHDVTCLIRVVLPFPPTDIT